MKIECGDKHFPVKIADMLFADFSAVHRYKKFLREFHYRRQRGVCYYCGQLTHMDHTHSKDSARGTLEHLEPVSVYREKNRHLPREVVGFLSHGDLSIENTVLACQKCNNSRPVDISPEDWKKMKAAG